MTEQFTDASPVVLEISEAVATLTFNRPSALNAANIEMAERLLQAVRHIEGDSTVRAVVLRGEGRSFMAGGDLSLLQQGADTVTRLIAPLHEALHRLAAVQVPVLASVHGPVAGAGVSIMLAADLAIAADNASFNLAYTKIGATPDASGSWHLPRVVGLRKALEIALLSETLDALEALRLSLVNRVVPASQLGMETARLAHRLAGGPTVALGRAKALMRASFDSTLAEQLAAEQAGFEACAGTDDFAEGVEAFLHKRAPRFMGR